MPVPKGQRFGGRQKGTPNKVTSDLKEAVLAAATEAGGKAGLKGYLRARAEDPCTHAAFLGILGRCLPKEVVMDATLTVLEKVVARAREIERAGVTEALS